MIENQVTTLTTILKNEDIRNYSGDAFINVIKAVMFGDIGALIDCTTDISNLLFHLPTVLFWDKMKRYMFGTFKDFEEQVKMAGKFNCDNQEYEKFVKKQIMLIDEINDDKKIDYFAQLTRCFLITEMEEPLFYKLARFLTMCTSEELDFIASFEYDEKTKLTTMVSFLYQYGLFKQFVKKDKIEYVLSDFGRTLKSNCLNFDENIGMVERMISYNQIAPINVIEPIVSDAIDRILK